MTGEVKHLLNTHKKPGAFDLCTVRLSQRRPKKQTKKQNDQKNNNPGFVFGPDGFHVIVNRNKQQNGSGGNMLNVNYLIVAISTGKA